MSLVYYTFAVFIIASILAFPRRLQPFWKLVDLVYYPLGAFGVVLLFAQQDIQREIIILQQTQEQNIQTAKELEASMQDTNSYKEVADLLALSSSHLNVIVEERTACDRLLSNDSSCISARSLGKLAEKYIAVFPKGEEPANLVKICKAAGNYFREIGTSTSLAPFISEILTDQFNFGLKAGFLWEEPEKFKAFIDSFTPRAQNSANELVTQKDVSQQKLFANQYKGDIRLADLSLRAFSPCFRAPAALKNDEFETWRASVVGAQAQVEVTDTKLKTLETENKKYYPSELFGYLIWPYLLMTALALKFGKGIVTIRDNGVGLNGT